MGSALSSIQYPHPEHPSFPYLAISFYSYNKVLILHGNQAAVNTIVEAATSIGGGKFETKEGGGSHVLTLNQWFFSKGGFGGKEKSISVKSFAADLLNRLYANGWLLICCTDISRQRGKSLWIFRNMGHQMTITQPICCISTSSYDSIHLINGFAVEGVVQEIIERYYVKGIQEISRPQENCVEYKLNGRPWFGHGDSKNAGRILLLYLLPALERVGYSYYGRGNLKDTSDCLFFMPGGVRRDAVESTYSLLSLDRGDRLRLYGASESTIALARSCLAMWYKGIQSDGPHSPGIWQFKMGGYPWCTWGNQAIRSRFIIMNLMAGLHATGSKVIASLDLDRTMDDKDVMIIQTGPHEARMQYMCVSLNDADKIRIIGADDGTIEMIAAIVQQHWSLGIQATRNRVENSVEIKWHGYPWDAFRTSTALATNNVMLHILAALEAQRWQFITSADVSSSVHRSRDQHGHTRDEYKIDSHSWYLARPLDLAGAVPPGPQVPFGASPYALPYGAGPSAPPLEPYPEGPAPAYEAVVADEKPGGDDIKQNYGFKF